MIHAAVEEPDAARWQRRLDPWVIAAALLAIPAVALHLLDVTGAWKTLAGVLSWAVWSVFAAEVVIMLRVSERPGRWARSHVLELFVLVIAFPVPALLESELYALEIAPSFEFVKLVKLAKLAKAVRVLRRRRSLPGDARAGRS